MTSSRMRQNEEEEARRRRHVTPPPPPPPAERVTTHFHGPHECYCLSCGYTMIVPAFVKCNELQCSACGDRMRASETGEYRGTEYGRSGITRRQE